MRVVSWNVRRAKSSSGVWPILIRLDPDIALLQEVGSLPVEIESGFDVKIKTATGKTGNPQKFSTAVITKGVIREELQLVSEYDWVNQEQDFFSGNIISCVISLDGQTPYNVVSVYSPAWPVNKQRIRDIDVSQVKLEQSPEVWVTEILWSLLRHTMTFTDGCWIIGGDYNSSETFDYLWKGGPHGNKEVMDRMNGLQLQECLRTFKGQLTPTFKNPKGGKIIHQLDHIYVSCPIYDRIENCTLGDGNAIFGSSLSDHLPIIADFTD